MDKKLLIIRMKSHIDALTHEEMCRFWRFAPPGHPYFNREIPEIPEHFMKRFKALGGMTEEISKEIGFEHQVSYDPNGDSLWTL